MTTPEQDILRAKEAQMILSHEVFTDAVISLNDHIIGKQASVNIDDKDMCQRLILTKQILDQFIHEFSKIINHGAAAKITMELLENSRDKKPRQLKR